MANRHKSQCRVSPIVVPRIRKGSGPDAATLAGEPIADGWPGRIYREIAKPNTIQRWWLVAGEGPPEHAIRTDSKFVLEGWRKALECGKIKTK